MMSNYKKNIDDFFKEKLANYRETPPPDAWDELETKLDGLKPGPTGFQYRWLMHFAIVSILLVLSVSLGRKLMSTPGSDGTKMAMNAQPTGTQATAPATGGIQAAATEQKATENTMPAAGTDATTGTGTNTNTTATGTNTNTTSANQSGNTDDRKGNNVAAAYANKKNNSKNAGGKLNTSKQHNNTYSAHYTQSNKVHNANKSTANNHKSNLSKPAPEEEGNDNNNNHVIAASPNTTLSVVSKPEETQAKETKKNEPVKKANPSIAAKNGNARTKPSFPRFEAGVKIGYEGGFNNDAAMKYVASPYAQYNLTPKFAVMTQPGVKYVVTPNKNLGAPQTFYNANPEDMQVTQGATSATSTHIGASVIWTYSTPYHYAQKHDSIIKSSSIGGSSMEFEVPVLVKYNITKKVAVYGGVNLVYNKLTSINENTYTAKGLVRSFDTTVVVTSTSATPPASTPPQVGFTYAGSPISDYQKMNATHSGYEFSTGYMVGFSVTAGKRLLFDALVEQSPATPDVKAGYNINTPLSSTYFRLSIGYKLK